MIAFVPHVARRIGRINKGFSMIDDPANVDLDKPVIDEPFDVPEPRNRPLWIVGAAAVLVLAFGAGYFYLRRPPTQPAPAAAAAPQQPKADPSAEAGEQIALPPLDETDSIVRELVGRLSSHPAVAAWLTTDGLILNFANVTLRISNGEGPVQELKALGPVPPFRPRTTRDDLFVDPASYRRYDRFAEAVGALDSRGVARLYATVKPRVMDAYRRLGQQSGDFDSVLERAIIELLKVPVVQGEIELAPSGIVYGYEDPRLEGLSTAQKHLLRMGPKNVQIVQSKLREIADYLAIPASRLPPPR
jgi:Protein of unknown function (DUF3014)